MRPAPHSSARGGARQRAEGARSRRCTPRRSRRSGAGTRSARRTSGPGCTGVSHWVEHMNFKGTTNIPRDQVKGIIEQFGGSWNGYTWIDQTTYLETATRDALDRMLFIEAERMANGLYDPEDCESERTVIISELQGGENDPDQLLEHGGDRHRVQGAPVPPSDHRLAARPADDDARRPVRPLPALLRARTTPRSSSSATSTPTTCCAASSSTSAASRPARVPRARADAPSRAQVGRAPRDGRARKGRRRT